jgi:hypothetical protein
MSSDIIVPRGYELLHVRPRILVGSLRRRRAGHAPKSGGPYDADVPRAKRSNRGARGAILSRRLVCGYLAAAVLGILGMHGLAKQCPATLHDATSMASSMVPHLGGASLMAGSDMAENGREVTVAPVADVAPVVSGVEPSLDEVLMLCGVMLLGTGASLALILRLRKSVPFVLLPRRGTPPRVWRTYPGGTGPPYVWEFAVIRC